MKVLALALGLAACRGERPPAATPVKDNQSVMPTAVTPTAATPTGTNPTAPQHTLEENTVAELSGKKVTLANVWPRPYTQAGGVAATGVAGVIGVSDGKQVVETVAGLGSRVQIGADLYEVVAVDGGDVATDRPGELTLRVVTRP
jgi:hypothetical protein